MESVLDRVIKQNTENVNLLKTKDYNIFSVLQIQSKEVLICRMIADLLNPRGQHGAGAEYLKIFLRDCLGMEKMDTKLADQAIVTQNMRLMMSGESTLSSKWAAIFSQLK